MSHHKLEIVIKISKITFYVRECWAPQPFKTFVLTNTQKYELVKHNIKINLYGGEDEEDDSPTMWLVREDVKENLQTWRNMYYRKDFKCITIYKRTNPRKGTKNGPIIEPRKKKTPPLSPIPSPSPMPPSPAPSSPLDDQRVDDAINGLFSNSAWKVTSPAHSPPSTPGTPAFEDIDWLDSPAANVKKVKMTTTDQQQQDLVIEAPEGVDSSDIEVVGFDSNGHLILRNLQTNEDITAVVDYNTQSVQYVQQQDDSDSSDSDAQQDDIQSDVSSSSDVQDDHPPPAHIDIVSIVLPPPPPAPIDTTLMPPPPSLPLARKRKQQVEDIVESLKKKKKEQSLTSILDELPFDTPPSSPLETPPSSPFSLATPPSSPLPISEDEEDSDDDDCIIVGYSKKIIVIDENTPIKTEFVDISDSVMNELIMACSPAHTIDLTDDENEDDDEPVRKAPPLMTYSQQQSPATYTNDLTFESCY